MTLLVAAGSQALPASIGATCSSTNSAGVAGGGGGGLTIEQPENNIVRGAYYALISALSGTQTMALCSYDEAYTIPFGEALTRRKGNDVTIATFGSMVPTALQAAEKLANTNIDAEVIDLRTLAPLDIDSVVKSVSKTKNIVVAEPGWRHFGAAAEIIAGVCENIGPELRSAPTRVESRGRPPKVVVAQLRVQRDA